VSLNFDKLSNVRIGKYVVINIEGNDKKKAEEDVKDMCKKLLANPIIEDYSFQIREI
jgi:phosphoribosylformylglycinamidine synthase